MSSLGLGDVNVILGSAYLQREIVMSLEKCKRCGGDGNGADANPTRPGVFNYCLACGGDGHVNVTNPSVLCSRCHGTGRHSDRHPDQSTTLNWCFGCRGTGYAS